MIYAWRVLGLANKRPTGYVRTYRTKAEADDAARRTRVTTRIKRVCVPSDFFDADDDEGTRAHRANARQAPRSDEHVDVQTWVSAGGKCPITVRVYFGRGSEPGGLRFSDYSYPSGESAKSMQTIIGRVSAALEAHQIGVTRSPIHVRLLRPNDGTPHSQASLPYGIASLPSELELPIAVAVAVLHGACRRPSEALYSDLRPGGVGLATLAAMIFDADDDDAEDLARLQYDSYAEEKYGGR